MTTIATDGKTMAGDGLVTSGDTVFGWNLQKVFRLTDGRLVGIAGSGYHFEPFLKWMEEGGDKPEFDENFEALVLYPDGTCRTFDEKCNSFPEEMPTAIGSGRSIALGALEACRTPREAVEIAAKRNTSTGGEITVLALSTPALKVA